MKAAANPSNQSHQSKANANHVGQQPTSKGIAFEPPDTLLFEDKRPETAAQRKLQVLANNSPQVKQLQALQEMAKKSVQAQNDATRIGNNAVRKHDKHVIQGAFIGGLGEIFSRLLPDEIGASNSAYSTLWEALNSSGTDIEVIDIGMGKASFLPSSGDDIPPKLQLPGSIILRLFEVRKSGGEIEDRKVHGMDLALVTHELSHAYDSIISGIELKGEQGTSLPNRKTVNVMLTEIRAWANEAAMEVEYDVKGSNMRAGFESVISSWFEDQATLESHIDNPLVARFLQYMDTNLPIGSGFDRAQWFESYGHQMVNAIKEGIEITYKDHDT